jgi:hypothetical protein
MRANAKAMAPIRPGDFFILASRREPEPGRGCVVGGTGDAVAMYTSIFRFRVVLPYYGEITSGSFRLRFSVTQYRLAHGRELINAEV